MSSSPSRRRYRPPRPPDYTTQLISRTTDEVESVTVTYQGDTYTILNNGDDGYSLEGQSDFKLDQDVASSLISRGTTLTTQSTASEKLPGSGRIRP